MWMRFVTEGLPVEGSPDLFEIQGQLQCGGAWQACAIEGRSRS
jgi:hypothetical protein